MYTTAKKKAQYKSDKPTMTDQSQAKDTDLNIIVRQLQRTGQINATAKQPILGADFTDAPTDLRGHIEAARNLQKLKDSLPENFRKLTLEQLATLDNKQLAVYDAIMNKQAEKRAAELAAKQTDKPQDPPK